MAVVSSSRNAEPVLRAAGLRDRFAVVVDGAVAAAAGLAGKPAPDTYLHAAGLLGRTAPSARWWRTPTPASRRGTRAGSGWSSASTGVPERWSCSPRGADLVVDDLADLIPGLPIAPEERA